MSWYMIPDSSKHIPGIAILCGLVPGTGWESDEAIIHVTALMMEVNVAYNLYNSDVKEKLFGIMHSGQ